MRWCHDFGRRVALAEGNRTNDLVGISGKCTKRQIRVAREVAKDMMYKMMSVVQEISPVLLQQGREAGK